MSADGPQQVTHDLTSLTTEKEIYNVENRKYLRGTQGYEDYKRNVLQHRALKVIAGILAFVCFGTVMLLILASSGVIDICSNKKAETDCVRKKTHISYVTSPSFNSKMYTSVSGVTLTRQSFGKLAGREIPKFTLKNKAGLELQLISYGATVIGLKVPDRHGNLSDISLGFSSLKDYVSKDSPYFGSIVGRLSNRIKSGKFTVDGREYIVDSSNGGFQREIWIANPDVGKVTFMYVSTDGDGGYPGHMTTHVTYMLTAANEVMVTVKATVSKACPVDISFNGYFNLAGHQGKSITDSHRIQLLADRYIPLDTKQPGLPKGTISSVDSIFDLRELTDLNTRIHRPQLAHFGGGFSHNWVTRGPTGLKKAARVVHKASGRVMELYTNQPSVHFSTGNHLDNVRMLGKEYVHYTKHSGFSLKSQNYPDAVNHIKDMFPDPILRPGTEYQHEIVYKFSTV